jgi:hypothetical protein
MVAAQAVRSKAIFKLLNAVLTLTAIVLLGLALSEKQIPQITENTEKSK